MWVLVSLQDPDVKHVLLCEKDYIVGRKDCDIVVENDAAVSRKHAKLHASHSETNLGRTENIPILTIEDLSKFGSWINKDRLQGQKIIQDGDELVFGSQKSVFTAVYEPFIVTSSCLDNPAKRKVRQLVCQLGGHVVNDWRRDCSLLLMNSLSVTIKVVCAMLSQKAIVSPEYLEAYVNFMQGVSPSPDTNNFLPHISESQVDPTEVNFNVDPSRKSLFQGKTFIFLQQKQFSKMSLAVELGGGTPILMEEKPGRGEDGILIEPDSVVMSCPPDKSKPAQWQEWQRHVEKTLSRHKKHMIQDAELGFAVLYCSTEKHCNPNIEFSVKSTVSHLPSQSLSQVPDFSNLEDSMPAGGKRMKQEKITPPSTPLKGSDWAKLSQMKVKPGPSTVSLKQEKESPSPVQRSQKSQVTERSQSPVPTTRTSRLKKETAEKSDPVKKEESKTSESSKHRASRSPSQKSEPEISSSSVPKSRKRTEHDLSRSPSPAPRTRSRSPIPAPNTRSRSPTVPKSRSRSPPPAPKSRSKSPTGPQTRSRSPSPAPKVSSRSPPAPNSTRTSPTKSQTRPLSPSPKTRLKSPTASTSSRSPLAPETRSRSPSPTPNPQKKEVVKSPSKIKGSKKVKIEPRTDEIDESYSVKTTIQQKRQISTKVSKRMIIDEDSDEEFGFSSKRGKKSRLENSDNDDDDFGSVRSKRSESRSAGSTSKKTIQKPSEEDIDDFGPRRNKKRNRSEEVEDDDFGSLRHKKRNRHSGEFAETKIRTSEIVRGQDSDHSIIIDSEEEDDPFTRNKLSAARTSVTGTKRIKTEAEEELNDVPIKEDRSAVQEGVTTIRKGQVFQRRVIEKEIIDEERPEPPDGFLTSRGHTKLTKTEPLVKQEEGAEEDMPSNLMVTVFTDLVHRPQRRPEEDGDAVPEGFAKWKNKTVRNFKKFRKVQHGGANRLPNIIGGSDLVPHIGTQKKEIEEWFREAQQMESQQTAADREATELFDWQPTVGARKKSRR